MTRYKLLKDLPGLHAGTMFDFIDEGRGSWKIAYCDDKINSSLEEILDDLKYDECWLERLPEEVKEEKYSNAQLFSLEERVEELEKVLNVRNTTSKTPLG